jgi:hypothetical protein
MKCEERAPDCSVNSSATMDVYQQQTVCLVSVITEGQDQWRKQAQRVTKMRSDHTISLLVCSRIIKFLTFFLNPLLLFLCAWTDRYVTKTQGNLTLCLGSSRYFLFAFVTVCFGGTTENHLSDLGLKTPSEAQSRVMTSLSDVSSLICGCLAL